MTARAFVCATLVASVGIIEAFAQTGPARGTTAHDGQVRTSTMSVELPMPPVAQTPVPLVRGAGDERLQTLSFVTPDTSFESTVVKGAPFTADSVTEHVQRLGDGNRMVRKSTAHLFRDSAGRTRREHTLTRGGGAVVAPDGQEPRLIIINDPVAQLNYLVDTAQGTLRKMHVPAAVADARRRAMGGDSFGILMPTSAAHRRMAEGEEPQQPAPKRERLETQLIEGVMAEGTRITVTIPAGAFDNEQPLEITHETWYSPELQMIVLLKHNDPRFGETTFRLTNITRAEPAPELFAEPQGLRVVGQREPPMMGRPVLREQ